MPRVGPRSSPSDRAQRIRTTLRAHGYRVDATGPLTSRLLSAWDDYGKQARVVPGVSSGRGGVVGPETNRPVSSKDWNEKNPVLSVKAQGKTVGNVADPVKDPVHKQLTKAVTNASKITKVHVKAAVHSKALTGKAGPSVKIGGSAIPGVKVGNPNVNKLIPAAMADKVAGLQFDPQIREALLQQERGKRDTAQAQKDISSWYGQVEGSQATAGQRDAAAADSARGSVSNELNGILQSLGGSRGAGVVAAQGLGDLAALAAQGKSQEQYNADLAPILQGIEAGQHSRQQALASQTAEKLGSQLIDLRGQRGQAQKVALQDIIARNNAARQGNFSNRLAVESTNAAAQLGGLKAADIVSNINYRDARARAVTAAARSKLTSKGTPSWLSLKAGEKDAAVTHALAPFLDPSSGALLPGVNPNSALSTARGTLRGYGYSSARRIGYKGPGVNPRAQYEILSLLHSKLAGAMTPQRAALPQTTPTAP